MKTPCIPAAAFCALSLVACSTPLPPETAVDVDQRDVDARSHTSVTTVQDGADLNDATPLVSEPNAPPPRNLPTPQELGPQELGPQARLPSSQYLLTPPPSTPKKRPPLTPSAPPTASPNDSAPATGGSASAEQGLSDADVNRTKQIRREIMASASLSFLAKNAKVTTNHGQVTLRGEVNSVEERSTLEAIARKIAGDAEIVNLLEIKH